MLFFWIDEKSFQDASRLSDPEPVDASANLNFTLNLEPGRQLLRGPEHVPAQNQIHLGYRGVFFQTGGGRRRSSTPVVEEDTATEEAAPKRTRRPRKSNGAEPGLPPGL